MSSAQGCQQGKGTGNLGEKAANGRFLSMHSLFRSRLGNSGIQYKPSVFPAEAMKQQGYSNTSDSSWSLGERLILTDGYIPSFLVSFVPAAREKKILWQKQTNKSKPWRLEFGSLCSEVVRIRGQRQDPENTCDGLKDKGALPGFLSCPQMHTLFYGIGKSQLISLDEQL